MDLRLGGPEDDLSAVEPEVLESVDPKTPQDLMDWLRELLPSSFHHVIDVIKRVFEGQRRAADRSKNEALLAQAQSMTEQAHRLQEQVATRDLAISNIGAHFEKVVAELQQKAGLDPKTGLLNLRTFEDRLQLHLGGSQRAPWCGVGIVDLTDFKWINDNLGHSIGDEVIERTAKKLAEQVRSEDIVAHERRQQQVHVDVDRRREDLHARYGGDEFCFLIPDLDHKDQAVVIAQRFLDAIRDIDWAEVDPRLVGRVNVDVGVVCLRRSAATAKRYGNVRRVAADLIHCADELMYLAKGQKSPTIWSKCVEVGPGGDLADLRC
ncbi:MAG TPA: GGDEF domain-containing protein [Patescibacteria group bacterium]